MAQSPIEKEDKMQEGTEGARVVPGSEKTVVEEGIGIAEETNPEAFRPADPKEALAGFAQEFGLPKDSKLGEVIQHVVDETGQSVTLSMLMQIAWMCGGTIQLEVTENEAVEPSILD